MTLDLPIWIFALFPLALLAASLFWGAPFMALVSELIGAVGGKPFPARVSRQLSRLALWGHAVCWILLAAAGAALYLFSPQLIQSEFVQSHRIFLLSVAAIPFCGAIILLIYDLTWKKARTLRVLHIFWISHNVGLKYGYWSLLAATLVFFRGIPLTSPDFLPPVRSALWPLAALWPVMSLSAAAGLGLFYLIMRRNKDDWGRDYYRFAAPFLGKWQFVGGIGTLAVLAWLFLSLKGIINLFLPQIFYAGAAGVVCLTAAMLLSLCLWFSENPMRLKGCMLGICLFLYLHCGLILTAVIEALNRYVSGWNIPTFMPEVLRYIL